VEIGTFARSFKLGKAEADDRVERALFSRAVGYDFNVEKQIMTRHGPRMLRWREHVPPDTAAALAYLKNRRPDRWRDRQIVEHQQRTPYDGIETAAELRALLQKQAQQLGLIPPPVINITPQQGVTDQKATDVPKWYNRGIHCFGFAAPWVLLAVARCRRARTTRISCSARAAPGARALARARRRGGRCAARSPCAGCRPSTSGASASAWQVCPTNARLSVGFGGAVGSSY
jgi:hypothetical protein